MPQIHQDAIVTFCDDSQFWQGSTMANDNVIWKFLTVEGARATAAMTFAQFDRNNSILKYYFIQTKHKKHNLCRALLFFKLVGHSQYFCKQCPEIENFLNSNQKHNTQNVSQIISCHLFMI